MGDKKVYSNSSIRVLLASGIVFTVVCLTITFSRGGFDIGGFKLGLAIGGGFALLLLALALGQKIVITEREFVYFPNMLSNIGGVNCKSIPLSEIVEVWLGLPRKHKNVRTFSAVNIASRDREITFNPDLFKSSTLTDMCNELKTRNSNVKFDEYTTRIMGKINDRLMVRK